MSTPEGEIQNKICTYLSSKRYFFWRNNTAPTWDRTMRNGYGAYRSMGKYALKGVPDIILIDDYGTFWGIEVKTPRGRLSPDQILFKKRCESHNGRYIVAKSVEDVIEALSPARG